jgi:hypothetical protein
MTQELIELRKLASLVHSGCCKAIDVVDYRERTNPAAVISLLDQIQSLQAEVNAANSACESAIKRAEAMEAERDALAAKLATVEADAERLDYLQEGVTVELLYSRIAPKFRVGKHIAGTSHDIRAAIDAAKGGQHEDA